MIAPTPSEIRAARANTERLEAIVERPCGWCGDHSNTLDRRASHRICDECSAVMETGAERDATDRDLVLIAVSAYRRAGYDAAVRPSTESHDRMDRAFRRIVTLLDKAMERQEREIRRLRVAAAETREEA